MKMKIITVLLFFAFTLSNNIYGQSHWSKMSPKQKIKLAKKEQKAAKKDPEYLKLMDEALILFQDGKYNEAKVLYNTAHNRRPDNVYPMVMLDDIEVAITLPKEELVVEEIIQKEIIVENIAPQIIEEKVEVEEEVNVIEEVKNEDIALEVTPIVVPVDTEIKLEEEKKEVVATEKVVITHPIKMYKEDGIYSEDLKEGNATIHQITFVEKGVSVVFRKVSHPWGAVYFFQNGDPITKAEWNKMQERVKEN